MTLSNYDENCDEAPQSSATALIMAELSNLDAKAEAMGATTVKESIASVIDDLTEPAGKESARIAIPEIRGMLEAFMTRFSVCPSPTVDEIAPASNLDEATA